MSVISDWTVDKSVSKRLRPLGCAPVGGNGPMLGTGGRGPLLLCRVLSISSRSSVLEAGLGTAGAAVVVPELAVSVAIRSSKSSPFFTLVLEEPELLLRACSISSSGSACFAGLGGAGALPPTDSEAISSSRDSSFFGGGACFAGAGCLG